jgi:hypothetical protein
MKHTEWLRLKAEGEQICSVFRQYGYLCTKQTRRFSWQISPPAESSLLWRGTGRSYALTWLPAPVGGWSILPYDNSLVQLQLLSLVQVALDKEEA